jgi:hypothetical protein
MKLKLINVLEYGLAPVDYYQWCHARNVPVMRVSLMKFRIREEDYIAFKLAFKQDYESKSKYDDDEI